MFAIFIFLFYLCCRLTFASYIFNTFLFSTLFLSYACVYVRVYIVCQVAMFSLQIFYLCNFIYYSDCCCCCCCYCHRRTLNPQTIGKLPNQFVHSNYRYRWHYSPRRDTRRSPIDFVSVFQIVPQSRDLDSRVGWGMDSSRRGSRDRGRISFRQYFPHRRDVDLCMIPKLVCAVRWKGRRRILMNGIKINVCIMKFSSK